MIESVSVFPNLSLDPLLVLCRQSGTSCPRLGGFSWIFYSFAFKLHGDLLH